MIHRTDSGQYVASSNQIWIPGVYDAHRTAMYAFKFSDTELQRLQDRANETPDRVITFADLQAAQRRRKAEGNA